MYPRWNELDRTLAVFEELQRRMNQAFTDLDHGRQGDQRTAGHGSWPPVNLYDTGEELLLVAQVPGVPQDAITINANQDVLTINGERKSGVPEGYSVHRQERGDVTFSRSFTFPCKVDLEQATAITRDGVLTVRLAKAPEAKPRQITVQAHSKGGAS